jgi:hypothetical protein
MLPKKQENLNKPGPGQPGYTESEVDSLIHELEEKLILLWSETLTPEEIGVRLRKLTERVRVQKFNKPEQPHIPKNS